MSRTPIEIQSHQADALRTEALGRLTGISDVFLATFGDEKDFELAARLAREFAEVFRLLDDLGWDPAAASERESAAVKLTMPGEELLSICTRIRDEAQGGMEDRENVDALEEITVYFEEKKAAVAASQAIIDVLSEGSD